MSLKDANLPAPECPRCGLNCAYCLNGECAYCKVDVSEPANAHDNDGNPLRMSASNGEPVKESGGREWTLHASRLKNGVWTGPRFADECEQIVVIEKSELELLKQRLAIERNERRLLERANEALRCANCETLTRRNAELAEYADKMSYRKERIMTWFRRQTKERDALRAEVDKLRKYIGDCEYDMPKLRAELATEKHLHQMHVNILERKDRELNEARAEVDLLQTERRLGMENMTAMRAELSQARADAFELKYKTTLELYDMRMRAERAEIAQVEHSKICGDSLFLRAERAEAAVKWLRGLIIDEGHIHFDFISAGLNKINSGKIP